MSNEETKMGDQPVWFITGCSTGFGRELARQLVEALPRNAERSVALRKLLEAKDAAVRANVPG